MKAIVNTGVGRLEMRDVPLPSPGPGQVRIRTAACGICATDLEMIDGDPRTPCPSILGHEWSGVVDAAGGSVEAALVGRHCVGENVLDDGGEVGFEHPGGYGQFLLTEAKRLRALPDDFPLPAAALIEPLAVCVRGLRRLDPQDRGGAIVLGDGPVGLILVMLLRRAGVGPILLVGGRPGRLALGSAAGAAATLNYHQVEGDLAEAVCRAAGGPAPNVLEVSGSPVAVEAAPRCARNEGKVLVLGDYGPARSGFRWNDLLHREIHLIGSNASAGAWDEAVRLAVAREVPLAELVTHRLPAERFQEGMDLLRNRRDDVVKVVLEW